MRATTWVAVLGVCAATDAAAQSTLSAYNVDPGTVTVSGISSGGFMAVQLQVAYSSRFFGAAIFAGGPYYCAQGSLLTSSSCESGSGIALSTLVTYTNNQATAGTIDPVSNLAGKPIYMFSGTNDAVVHPATMSVLQQYYTTFTAASNITFNNTTPAEHAWISLDGPNTCGTLGSPYINNCQIDAEQTFLGLFYGTLAARNGGTLGGTFIKFNQNPFCPGSSCSGISMDSTGWVFVPASCAAGQACKLVVALHGCLQYQGAVQQQFVDKSGLNEWADTNGIVVLYPQATTSLSNGEGCWDWWGYTNSSYALKSGPQMKAIMGMVDQIVSGHTGGAPATPTGLAVSGSTSTSVSLSWNSSSGASSYTLYRNGSTAGTSASTALADTGLTPSTTYSYQVTASNASGESAKSAAVQATTLPAGSDAGTPPGDAGAQADAGSQGGGDGGSTAPDAGSTPDAGGTPPGSDAGAADGGGGGGAGGCGCGASSSTTAALGALLAGLMAMARRRRRSEMA